VARGVAEALLAAVMELMAAVVLISFFVQQVNEIKMSRERTVKWRLIFFFITGLLMFNGRLTAK